MRDDGVSALDAQVRSALVGCDVEAICIDRYDSKSPVGRLLWRARDAQGRAFKIGWSSGCRRPWDTFMAGVEQRWTSLGEAVVAVGVCDG